MNYFTVLCGFRGLITFDSESFEGEATFIYLIALIAVDIRRLYKV